MTDRATEMPEGIRLAHLAVRLGQNDPVALTRGGHALAHLTGDLDGGIALLDRALVLDPNLAAAWYLSGFLRALKGEYNRAVEQLLWAMRLSPVDREMYRMQAGMALANLFAGRFDEASSWAEKAFSASPDFLAVAGIIASHIAKHPTVHQGKNKERAKGWREPIGSTVRNRTPVFALERARAGIEPGAD